MSDRDDPEWMADEDPEWLADDEEDDPPEWPNDDGDDPPEWPNDDEGDDVDDDGPPLREQAADALDRAVVILAGTERKRAIWRMVIAVGAVGGVLVGFAAVAWLGWGALSGALFIVGLVVGASGPPLAILMFRDGLPLGGLVGTGLAIAAQVAFGKAALVRRDDGEYEWTALREDADEYYATLDRGDRVAVAADDGDLFAFGFGQLAVVEQHTDAAVDEYRAIDTPGASDQPVDERAGVDVLPPRRKDGGILVTLAKIQRRVRGSASSKLVRRGRDKALDEEGGEGQLSQLWTMAFATILLIVGFGMTIGALLL